MTQLQRDAETYQPSNITFSHLPPWEGPRLQKRAKYEAMAARALRDLRSWMTEHGLVPQLAEDSVMNVPGLTPAPADEAPLTATDSPAPA
jgi:hypothetical protein